MLNVLDIGDVWPLGSVPTTLTVYCSSQQRGSVDCVIRIASRCCTVHTLVLPHRRTANTDGIQYCWQRGTPECLA